MKKSSFISIGLISLFLGSIALITKYEIDSTPTIVKSDITKIDSLQNVIDSLQSDIKILEDGFDVRETRYEDIIFRYEMSLDYLKHNHSNAYRDFIRISQMKEKYDRKSEAEFKKEMQLNNL
jgi:hypothetical protein